VQNIQSIETDFTIVVLKSVYILNRNLIFIYRHTITKEMIGTKRS